MKRRGGIPSEPDHAVNDVAMRREDAVRRLTPPDREFSGSKNMLKFHDETEEERALRLALENRRREIEPLRLVDEAFLA